MKGNGLIILSVITLIIGIIIAASGQSTPKPIIEIGVSIALGGSVGLVVCVSLKKMCVLK